MWKVILIRKNGDTRTIEYPDMPHPEIRMFDDSRREPIQWGADNGELARPVDMYKIVYRIYAREGQTLFYEET